MNRNWFINSNTQVSWHFIKSLRRPGRVNHTMLVHRRMPEAKEFTRVYTKHNESKALSHSQYVYNRRFRSFQWTLVIKVDPIIIDCASKTVKCYVDGDGEADFVFFASYCVDGAKLWLILIVRVATSSLEAVRAIGEAGCHMTVAKW
jgi:hypothetical protein